MKEILLNLANWHMIQFCLQNNIDCSNTQVFKQYRGYTYALVRNNKPIVSVYFSKSSAPAFMIHK